ncbi:FAD:protein FMN transferase [Luteolibacter ambystomatis]|uniref:FAD:protein FMN transferase n=1 Tax=Luteolibacter ambystomatis TaxID=2824561 RepID=A0A975IYZ8_9BACT|nr:FAD:protein FMN transferase [Luteolibacter ambystomatis]QUE50654.1 FAD:protein FMN transferase [Luteolibacter ambystomatis]
MVSIVVFGALSVARAEEQRFTFERGLMGTRFAITTHGTDEATAKKAAEAAFAKAEEINAVASDYIADSEVLSLSKAPAGKATVVSSLLFDILTKARRAAEITEGRFDPTIGPLTKLWRETRRRSQLPDADTLSKARAACDWQALKLDPETRGVILEKPGMRIDLGGIAKGYAADAMFAILHDRGFPRTCVAAGGDLRLGDPPPGQKGWKVGIRSLEKGKLSDEIPLSNCGVSTSGDLQQFVEIGGVRYSHIIDPSTGLGMTRHLAVTIVAWDTTISDSFDNAACLAGPDRAEALAKSWGAARVIVTVPPLSPSPAPADR